MYVKFVQSNVLFYLTFYVSYIILYKKASPWEVHMKKKIPCALLLILSIAVFLTFAVSCKEKSRGEIGIINVDYKEMTYVGNSLKDFSKLFDEQENAKDPRLDNPGLVSETVAVYDADSDGDIDEDDLQAVYDVTVDLKCVHYVDSIYVYYQGDGKSITVEAGTPFKYEFSKTSTGEKYKWTRIDIGGDYRYVNLSFKNGQAPTEILFYGYEVGERDEINTESHKSKPFSYFLGINGNIGDKYSELWCANYFRDYFTWTRAYNKSSYPNPGTHFIMDYWSYDRFYNEMTLAEVSVVPCLMYTSEADSPALEGSDRYSPASYVMYGEFVHQFARRYGFNPNTTDDDIYLEYGAKLYSESEDDINIKWIEIGNEPNGEGNNGYTPYQLAALTSCAYDGHNSTVKAPDGSGVGIKTANPDMKVAMAGLAGINKRYIESMVFWLVNNRPDGTVGLDAFNVHNYCRKQISYNGYTVYTGVCPEIGNIVSDELKELIDYRNKYYPDIEIWLTEFGWDTNQSYETENSAHAYGPYTGRQVQAMWLVRAYFMFAEAGIDRAAMYMCKDVGNEETSVGKYGTSGVVTSDGEYKDSYYYIYTLKNNMNDMYFAEVIDSGNEDVWIYRFENGEGKSCYAVWCPTMDDVRVDNFKLNIDGSNATLVEFRNEEKSGVSSSLEVSDGAVTVNVSECPILVFSD